MISALQRLTARLGRGADQCSFSASEVADAENVLSWVHEYLGAPHPELGRTGAVCPFAIKSASQDRLRIAADQTDGASPIRLRRRLLAHGRTFERSAAQVGTGVGTDHAALIVTFPRLPSDRHRLLDELHDELKTSFMNRDVMVSAFHPQSARPALWNEHFRVLRAPFAAFAFRRMDVRDIVFLGHNEAAFARYRRRFGALHALGGVPDRYGYASAYAAALERFQGR